jgi:hypothetical protein
MAGAHHRQHRANRGVAVLALQSRQTQTRPAHRWLFSAGLRRIRAQLEASCSQSSPDQAPRSWSLKAQLSQPNRLVLVRSAAGRHCGTLVSAVHPLTAALGQLGLLGVDGLASII